MSEDMPLATSAMATSSSSGEDPVAWLEAQEKFQQAKAEYKIYLESIKSKTASQRTEELEKLPLPELVKLLDEQPPFDLTVGITDFLQEIGAFNEPQNDALQGNEQANQLISYSEELLIDATDLELLASILPPPLASKLSRSPFPKVHSDADLSALKASLLNTLARLALSPPLTIPIARSFRPIFTDLASRWLLLLGFQGTGFAPGHGTQSTLVRVLAALARTLPEFPQCYPILLLALHHPHLQADSIKSLLSEATTFTVPEGPSTALNPSPAPSELIHHPDLPQLLLTLYALLVVVPQLPLLRTIRHNFGGPAPPEPVGDVLSSHPHLAMRTLAWHITSLWFGWKGPKKEELRRKYVYDPVLDDANGQNGLLKFDLPIVDPGKPQVQDDWLAFWPRIPEEPIAHIAKPGGLKVRLEIPHIDAWNFSGYESMLSTHEWTLERPRMAEESAPPAQDGDMQLEPAGLVAHRLSVEEVDRSPLLANVAGVAILKEGYIASMGTAESESGRALKYAQTASTSQHPSVYIPTSTSVAALRQLALHVAARTPVLLSSPPSAGKETTLQELHRILYSTSSMTNGRTQDVVTINLADKSLDAKSLLGSLTSSPSEPGAFVFAEGSLTRAIRYGRWVVLEDIDKASDEVLSTVSELVERIRTRAQEVVGGGWGGVTCNGVGVYAGGQWVEASENFMLFATRSVPTSAVQAQLLTAENSSPPPSFFGCQYWSQVWMEVPSLEEIQSIVEGRFPRLSKQIVLDLVQTWADIVDSTSSICSTSTTGLSRSVGIRDLVKWCSRVEAALPTDIAISTLSQNPRFQDEVFLEARDIFLSSFSTRNATYEGVLQSLRVGLDLSQERVDWALKNRVPEVLSGGDKPGSSLQYGRIALKKGKVRERSSASKRPYALTKPFLVLLEQLAAAVKAQEPLLLVGETGTGKTTAVAQLADMLGHNLTALNMSNQTEASDLLGGFRPINEADEIARHALELINEFTDLFAASFEASRNLDFGVAVQKAFKKKRWPRLSSLFREAARLAEEKISRSPSMETTGNEGPRKKRKMQFQDMLAAWLAFRVRVASFEELVNEANSKSSKFKFSFVEGPLIRAVRNGDWVLLDEVNLATSETLDSLSSLLQSASSSLVLTERGDLEPVQRHPDFRLFACMNPANDVGKRDLLPALRVKFTEVFVAAPDADPEVLLSVVNGYIGHVAVGDRGVVQDIAELYLRLKSFAQAGRIADGSNHPPHFSMRTLARSLVFASDFARDLGIRRSAYEGIAMCFTTSLEVSSKNTVFAAMHEYLVDRSKSPRSFFKSPLSPPSNTNDYVSVGSFWLAKGRKTPQAVDDYVLTASVEDKLVSLARAVAAARFPILLQGPTSSGKTSIIEYLAKRSGHTFVRINNHEHTDIQEYLGTYTSDLETGKLVFQEGLLVTAVREGHWIVLDELNLAPTDVLEALNRLLDDNRELVIPETQEIVRPHPHFMLFATQNPPGLYGGRKVLSRAFRNRFLEMQFSDVPQDELETILCQRCQIAPSYAKKIVAVFHELQRRRQNTRLFDEKQAFVTLRDLFRWGNRGAVGYEQLALDGYMLLAERTRKEEDKQTVKEVIEQIMKVTVEPREEYETMFHRLYSSTEEDHPLVWTTAMKRLYVLIQTALSFNEPVLLVGETGSGKTSVCQAIASVLGRKLHIVNCHQNTETSDLIGSQRPVRNRRAVQESLRLEAFDIFKDAGVLLSPQASFDAVQACLQTGTESQRSQDILNRMSESEALFMWHDGPLVEAMRHGDMILLDEISLADDSVLERLNSVLEPARTLTIAEKGSQNATNALVRAHDGFQIVGTMNPGGDFGKKELSPALRNRFTEVWVPWLSDDEDILGILHHRLGNKMSQAVAPAMLAFARWFTGQILPREPYQFGSVVTLRDLLAWADFLITYAGEEKDAFVHGAMMTLVDALGSTAHTSGIPKSTIAGLRDRALAHLVYLVSGNDTHELGFWTGDHVFNHFLSRIKTHGSESNDDRHFSFSAPTVHLNALRVLRALQVTKPILLEGSPGVGKTSLVMALARTTQHQLCRINLSDQTDLVDLFGSDSPVEGGKPGEFNWVDAPFLRAMQDGQWVLLDEMNLASQSVLEGLNSCLDHRGSVYIPELDKVFSKHPNFRIFAAQNPTNQGGSRKGLPRSFVDRFTQVYMDDLDDTDYFEICRTLHPSFDSDSLRRMVTFVVRLSEEVERKSSGFQSGAPWELNLRDLLRWISMMAKPTGYERHPRQPVEFLDTLFMQRFRQASDREIVMKVYEHIFGRCKNILRSGRPLSSSTNVRIGRNIFSRLDPQISETGSMDRSRLNPHLRAMEALGTAVLANQLLILTGPSGSGKTTLIQDFANLAGRSTRTFHVNAQTDTLEMLGSFEQSSRVRHLATLFSRLRNAIDNASADCESWSSWARLNRMSRLLSNLGPNLGIPQARQDLLEKLCSSAIGTTLQGDVSLFEAALADLYSRGSEAGRFEFVEGILVRAMLAGDILIIENANRCNPAVLDRLNGLFETGGRLFLSERGLAADGTVLEVTPHPNFRVVMTLDPRAGELSRAMRNRGIEIALLEEVPVKNQPHLYQQVTGTISSRASRSNQSGIRELAISSDRDFGKARLLQSVGSHPLANLPLLQHQPSATSQSMTLVNDMLPNAIWTCLAEHRPGEVGGDLPAQSHQITFFSLDTNEALKERAESDVTLQMALDDMVSSLLEVSAARLKMACQLESALAKPISALTVLEQSYVHSTYPARLPTAAKGVESVLQLQAALLETAKKAIGPAAISSLNNIVPFLHDVSGFLCELSNLGATRSLNYSIYQSLLLEMRRLFSLAVVPEFLLPHFHALEKAVTRAEDSVKRSSGHYMEAIWTYFQRSSSASVPPQLIACESCDVACLPSDLTALYLDVVRASHAADGGVSTDLLRGIRERVLAYAATPIVRPLPPNAGTLYAISELATISQILVHPSARTCLIQVASQVGHGRLVTLHPAMQHIAGQSSSSMQMLREWLDRLVSESGSGSGESPSKVHDLLTDSELRTAIDLSLSCRRGPLSSINSSAEALEIAGKVQFELSAVTRSSRKQALSVLALALIVEVLRAAQLVSVPDVDYTKTADLAQGLASKLNECLEVPGTTCLRDALLQLSNCQYARSCDMTSLSRLFAAFATWYWRLYVPDIPLDPLLASHVAHALYTQETEGLLAAAVVADADTGTLGGQGARRLDLIAARIQTLEERLPSASLISRDDTSSQELLTALYTELRACTGLLLNSNILESIVQETGHSTRPQLENLQASLVSIHTRLQAFYVAYSDLVRPLTVGLGSAILGLGIRIQELHTAGQGRLQSVVTEAVIRLVARPSHATARALVNLEMPTSLGHAEQSSVAPAAASLLTLQAFATLTRGGQTNLSVQDFNAVFSAYDQIYALWTIDHKRAEQARIQSESIYRSRRQDIEVASDAAQEEEELLALFPTFDDLQKSEDLTISSSVARIAPTGNLLRIEDISAVYAAHSILFSSEEDWSLHKDSAKRSLAVAKRELLDDLHASYASLIDERVDLGSASSTLQVLAEAAQTFSLPKASRSANFYHDANIQECLKLRDILTKSLERIGELRTAWPEQMVLVELVERCDALLAVPSSAPVAKLLTFVESLLFKITDWEAYASRETSLRSVSDHLTALVVEWRRLELQSWAGLLEAQEKAFREPVAEWWFRLFDVCVHGPTALAAEEPVEHADRSYVETLIQLVRAFIEGSPAGQFRDRLSLVNTFARFTQSIRGSQALYSRISTTLHNIVGFYTPQAGRIDSFLKEERQKVVREVNEVIRLASWKDVNVYALKASAQKSHRQLYKRVRALRKVLETPSSRFTDNQKVRDINQPRAPPGGLGPVHSATPHLRPALTTLSEAAISALPKPLVELESTLLRLEQLVDADSVTTESAPAPRQLDILTETMIHRSQELRAEEPTGKSKEEREKQAKTLMDRKRKAWSSLLAEVKRIGLSPRPSTAVVHDLSDMAMLFNTGPLSSSAFEQMPECRDLMQDLDTYFYRLCALMPQVRSAASQHHPDVIPSQLQAAAGSLDSALKMIHAARSQLCRESRETSVVADLYIKLQMIHEQGIAAGQIDAFGSKLERYHSNFYSLQCALEEILTSGHEHMSFMAASDKTAFDRIVPAIQECLSRTQVSIQRLKNCAVATEVIAPMTVVHVEALEFARGAWLDTYEILQSTVSKEAQFAYLLKPVTAWMDENEAFLTQEDGVPTRGKDTAVSSLTAYVASMSSILVSIQKLDNLQKAIIEENDDYVNGGLELQSRQLRERVQVLHIGSIGQRLRTSVEAIASLASRHDQVSLASQLITRSIPVLSSYLKLVYGQLDQYIAWQRALLKFAYILAQTTLTLATEGFCRPSEPEDGPGQANNFEGTGMGSGEGTTNVSDQIENQEQVEGLANEQEQDSPANQGEERGKDDMLDMEDDFGGKTEDVDQQDSDKESDDGEDRDEGSDVDDELGNVDPLDPSAMDDKFWEDKQDQQNDAQSPPPDEQSGQKAGEEDPSGLGEREEPKKEEERDAPDGPAPESKADGPESELENQNPDIAPDALEEEANDAEEAEEGPRQELPDVQMDETTLDLPDDLQLDTHRSDDEDEDDEMDDELQADQQNVDEGVDEAVSGEHEAEDRQEEVQGQDSSEDTMNPTHEDGAMQHQSAGANEESGEDAGRIDNSGNQAGKEPHSSSGGAAGTEPHSTPAEEEDTTAEPSERPEQRSQRENDTALPPTGDGNGAEDGMESTSKDQSGQSLQDSDNSKPDDRQLGDDARNFMRRLEAIFQPGDLPPEQDSAQSLDPTDPAAAAELEYVREGEEDTGLQAMGAADVDIAMKHGVELADPEMVDEFQALDLDHDQPTAPEVLLNRIPQVDVDGAASSQNEDAARREDTDRSQNLEDQYHDLDQDGVLADEETLQSRGEKLDRAEVELQHWLADGRESLPSDEVWRLYTNLTRDLSFSLTESLRLVLEPTQASRLKGDYRTGKRLNMRKIIPYIASDYTKDKIWLRRTRPSQREYQVLLALDDSRSMADSRAVHLAYQTLALVCQSLTKLEVGEVSVCKFGEHTDFIHAFEDGPVSDTVGAKIVESFQFAQKTTDVKRLLESSLHRFQVARDRRGGSAADLWQLEIIVSDGMCQDLEDIRSLLRKARQQKVMVMFVVLDSLHGTGGTSKNGRENSILSMKSVSYEKSKSGTLELKMERYMDTFPFEYYVVLRDVETLPEVLGETLRQFFDKVRGDSS